MSEIRRDPMTKEWVILSRERSRRPHDFKRREVVPAVPPRQETCPFCPGNEGKTPEETFAFRDGPAQAAPSRWRVRVIPNKFPALAPRGTTRRKEEGIFFLSMDGVGFHEIVVETPSHNRPIPLMDEEEVFEIIMAYRERYMALRWRPGVSYIIIFKNHGPSAGTSLDHPHSQLVATPVVPLHIRSKYEVATSYYDETGRCIYCDLIQEELSAGKRVVIDAERFVAFHPYASRVPFETWIVPKAQQASFGKISADDARHLARVFKELLAKFYYALDNPDYNYVIHTAPIDDEDKSYYLWHVQILPRLTMMAGFELGSGIYINTAMPEETASFMRSFKLPTT